MLSISEILILIATLVFISMIIGLMLVNVVDQKLGELTINIPETKVVLRGEDMKKICSLKPLTENFTNMTNYQTSEKYYNANYNVIEKQKQIVDETELIPENYSKKIYAPLNYNKKILDGKYAVDDISKVKPYNYVFKS